MENNVLTIFTRIRQRLHTTARSIAGEDNADDVLQDAFCKLWTLKNMPPDQQQTERIAATIVKNVSIDYLRSAHRSVQPANVCGATDDAKEQDMRERFDAVKRIVEMQLSDTQRRVLLDARLRGILVRRDCRRRRHDGGECKTDAFESAKTDS